MVKLLDEFYLFMQCVLRCLRLNTHISSSNISVQTLPKEGEKHHFFQERNHQKNLTTWLLEKDIAEEKSYTCSTRRQNAFIHTWHWIKCAPNDFFYYLVWFWLLKNTNDYIASRKKHWSLTSKLVFETSSQWIIAKFIMSNKFNWSQQ